MTYFLDAPTTPAPRRNPDLKLTDNWSGLGAAVEQGWQAADVGAQRSRQVKWETQLAAEPAANRLGIEALNERFTQADAGYDHLRPAPTTVDDFFAMHGPRASEIALELAREKAAAEPDAWKDLDLSPEGIETRVTEQRAKELEENQQIIAMSPNPGRNSVLGEIGAAIADPINIALAPLGGGGGSLLRIMGREAMINAGAEAVQFPARQRVAKELGQAAPDFLESVALGAVGGAALGGVFHGVGRAVQYFKTRSRVHVPVGESPINSALAANAAEDALIVGDDPIEAARAVVRKIEAPYLLENPINPTRPPLMAERTPMVESQDFKDWSSGTAVADPQGKPIAVFHGTYENFQEFDPGKGGLETGAKDAQGAIFFTNSPEVASSYVHDDPYNANAVDRFLNKITGGRAAKAVEGIKSAFGMKSAYASGGNVRPSYLSIKNPQEVNFGGREYDEAEFHQIISQARKDGRDGVIIRQVDDSATDGKPPADVYVVFDKNQVRSTFDPRNREPLISEAPVDKTMSPSDLVAQGIPPVETSVLPPMAGDLPQSTDELVAAAQRAIDASQTADSVRAKPLISYLRDNHRVTKAQTKTAEKAGRPAPTGGESLQIDPAGTLGGELKAQGITPKTQPGLFKKGGRTDLDNLVASEMEDQFPGIMEATRTPYGSDYLDQQGVIDLIIRDANGDSTWLRSRADAQKAQADLDAMMRETPKPQELFQAQARAPGGLFIDTNAYEFTDGFSFADAIEADVNAYLDREWPEGMFMPSERREILDAASKSGGDIEYLAQSVLSREIDYAELPKHEAYPHELPEEAIFGIAPASSAPDARGGSAGTAGEQNAGATGGGRAGEAGGDRAVEQTAAGEQSLIPGVKPITERQRLEAAQQRVLGGGPREADSQIGGLFDPGAKSRTDLFSDAMAPAAREFDARRVNDLREEALAGGYGDLGLVADDGRALNTLDEILTEIDEMDALEREIAACRLGKAPE